MWQRHAHGCGICGASVHCKRVIGSEGKRLRKCRRGGGVRVCEGGDDDRGEMGDRDAEVTLRGASSGAGGTRGGLIGDVDIRRVVRYGLLSHLWDRLIFTPMTKTDCYSVYMTA
jgi:hypothetical protein